MAVRYENLSEIVQADNLACLELYHSNGSDMQAVNENGESGLIEACRLVCSNDLVEYLLRLCDVNATDHKGRTALFWAAYYGSVQHVRLLLENGASTDMRDKDGKTPIMAAVQKGYHSIANLLLGANADTSLKDKNGNTVLHWCVTAIKVSNGPVDGIVAAFTSITALASDRELPVMRNKFGDAVYDLINELDDVEVANKLLRILQNAGGVPAAPPADDSVNRTTTNAGARGDPNHHRINHKGKGKGVAEPDSPRGGENEQALDLVVNEEMRKAKDRAVVRRGRSQKPRQPHPAPGPQRSINDRNHDRNSYRGHNNYHNNNGNADVADSTGPTAEQSAAFKAAKLKNNVSFANGQFFSFKAISEATDGFSNRYLLAFGESCEVYNATVMCMPCYVKVFRLDFGCDDLAGITELDPAVRIFRVELFAAFSLSHINVAPFAGFSIGNDGNLCVLYTGAKAILSEQLALEGQRLSAEVKLGWILDVFRGVAYLHAARPASSAARNITTSSIGLYQTSRGLKCKIIDKSSAEPPRDSPLWQRKQEGPEEGYGCSDPVCSPRTDVYHAVAIAFEIMFGKNVPQVMAEDFPVDSGISLFVSYAYEWGYEADWPEGIAQVFEILVEVSMLPVAERPSSRQLLVRIFKEASRFLGECFDSSSCVVCWRDNMPRCAPCANSHKVCDECLAVHVGDSLASNPAGAPLVCPVWGCGCVYDMEVAAQVVTVDARANIYAAIGGAAPADSRAAHEALVGEIMSLHCPDCNNVYYNFDGTTELSCRSCNTRFCSLCPVHGNSLRADHAEVAHGSAWTTPKEVRKARRVERTEQLRAAYARLGDSSEREVFVSVAESLVGPEIFVKDFAEDNNAAAAPATEEDFRIYNEIAQLLTLSCPYCSLPFYDFDNCAAIECPQCSQAFCGVCLEPCGGDAHPHVTDNHGGSVYVSEEALAAGHKAVKIDRLINYLCTAFGDESERLRVLGLVSPLLEPKIHVEEVAAAVAPGTSGAPIKPAPPASPPSDRRTASRRRGRGSRGRRTRGAQGGAVGVGDRPRGTGPIVRLPSPKPEPEPEPEAVAVAEAEAVREPAALPPGPEVKAAGVSAGSAASTTKSIAYLVNELKEGLIRYCPYCAEPEDFAAGVEGGMVDCCVSCMVCGTSFCAMCEFMGDDSAVVNHIHATHGNSRNLLTRDVLDSRLESFMSTFKSALGGVDVAGRLAVVSQLCTAAGADKSIAGYLPFIDWTAITCSDGAGIEVGFEVGFEVGALAGTVTGAADAHSDGVGGDGGVVECAPEHESASSDVDEISDCGDGEGGGALANNSAIVNATHAAAALYGVGCDDSVAESDVPAVAGTAAAAGGGDAGDTGHVEPEVGVIEAVDNHEKDEPIPFPTTEEEENATFQVAMAESRELANAIVEGGDVSDTNELTPAAPVAQAAVGQGEQAEVAEMAVATQLAEDTEMADAADEYLERKVHEDTLMTEACENGAVANGALPCGGGEKEIGNNTNLAVDTEMYSDDDECRFIDGTVDDFVAAGHIHCRCGFVLRPTNDVVRSRKFDRCLACGTHYCVGCFTPLAECVCGQTTRSWSQSATTYCETIMHPKQISQLVDYLGECKRETAYRLLAQGSRSLETYLNINCEAVLQLYCIRESKRLFDFAPSFCPSCRVLATPPCKTLAECCECSSLFCLFCSRAFRNEEDLLAHVIDRHRAATQKTWKNEDSLAAARMADVLGEYPVECSFAILEAARDRLTEDAVTAVSSLLLEANPDANAEGTNLDGEGEAISGGADSNANECVHPPEVVYPEAVTMKDERKDYGCGGDTDTWQWVLGSVGGCVEGDAAVVADGEVCVGDVVQRADNQGIAPSGDVSEALRDAATTTVDYGVGLGCGPLNYHKLNIVLQRQESARRAGEVVWRCEDRGEGKGKQAAVEAVPARDEEVARLLLQAEFDREETAKLEEAKQRDREWQERLRVAREERELKELAGGLDNHLGFHCKCRTRTIRKITTSGIIKCTVCGRFTCSLCYNCSSKNRQDVALHRSSCHQLRPRQKDMAHHLAAEAAKYLNSRGFTTKVAENETLSNVVREHYVDPFLVDVIARRLKHEVSIRGMA